MSDADDSEPAICETLGCVNTPVEGGYCAEYADILPSILAGNENDDTPEKGHRASDVSLSDDEPERQPDESSDSGSYSTVEASSGDGNADLETRKPITRERRVLTRAGVPPSDHFITKACDEAYHKLGKINSAEGESHLPAGGSQQSCACFFPAQDNIVCHSPSDSYGLLSETARATNTLGHDGSPGRQRWNDGAHE